MDVLGSERAQALHGYVAVVERVTREVPALLAEITELDRQGKGLQDNVRCICAASG
jgi:hypothetical protein